jgi:uncharacterized membrane protein
MIKNMIKTFEFWCFVAILIGSVVFTAVDSIGWEAGSAIILGAAITLGLIGKKRAAKNG